jgi:tetratricopeptide (TPR) repeat protein
MNEDMGWLFPVSVNKILGSGLILIYVILQPVTSLTCYNKKMVMNSVFRQLCGAAVFLLVSSFSSRLSAQDQDRTYDSLKQVLATAKVDTVRISALEMIGAFCKFEEVRAYSEECAALCEKGLVSGKGSKQFYEANLASAIANIGYCYSMAGDREKGLKNYQRALEIYEKLGEKDAAALLLNNIAQNLVRNGDFSKAIEYYFRNLKVQEEIGDKAGQVYTLNNIGEIYVSLHDNTKALDYHTRALKIAQSINNTKLIAQSLDNIGQIYDFLGQFPKALEYYNQSYVKFEEIHDVYGICVTLSNIGGAYIRTGDNKKAVDYLIKSIRIAEKQEFKTQHALSLFHMAEVLINEGKVNEALPYAKKSLEMAKELHSPREMWVAARTLKTIYEKQHKFQDAYAMFNLEVAMHDSLNNETNRKNAMKQELQYEYEKKELQVKLMKEKELSDMRLDNERQIARRNTILYIVLSLAMLLGISIFFLYKFYKQRNIINASRNNELRRKLLLNQMNPHFIFNSVDNIQSLIHNKQDKEAISYLGKFSRLTRQILENSNEDHISLGEELNTIENYLTIQQLLYNNSFTFSIEVDEHIDKENVFVPPMLTQPFVENAIKHGLKNKKEGGVVKVKFYMKDNSLFFEVSDNGNGLAENTSADHRSMSTRIVKERLNSNTGKVIAISTRNKVENNEVKGVVVTFELPYIQDK